MPHTRVLAAIQSELWAITPEALNQVVAVAQGFGDPEAVATKLGRPLDNTRTVTVRDGVAVVPVIGPVFRYANLFTEISGASSIQTLAKDLQTAVDDPAVKAIVLEIDSPGGQVAGVSEFAAQIRAANAVKPVSAYISDIGASAAYWIASAAGEIIAADTARIGSIGVVMQAVTGEEPDTIKFISAQSPLKQADPGTEAGKEQYQKTVNALADVFINTVADNRGVDADTVINQFGQGGMLLAADAIAAGMADRLGSLESLIASLSAGTPTLNHKQRGHTMPITREQLAAEAPDLLLALTEEGRAAGYQAGITAGAEAERNRIKDIEALAMPGHDDLIASIKFDGQTTAGEAAVKILAAEKATRESMSAKITEDTPTPVKHAVPAMNDNADPEDDEEADEDDLDGTDNVEASAKTKWKKDASIRAEFRSFDSFLAFERANARGAVRIKGA